MDLITTHTNADFDALGSLIAAKRLYPNSQLLLPGSPEKAVREFLSLFKDVIKIETEGECNLEGVDRLIVVDTRHKSRIGIASRLIDEKGIKPVIYDHHPKTEYDMPAEKEIYKQLGATVTILLEIIRRRRIKLTPLEATILLLGIYEETGSLTFRTTTKKDVDAVSFLLSQGAKLNMVSSYLNKELSEGELAFLVQLINSTHIYNINGIKVAISECQLASYIEQIGTVIHKLIDVENLKVVFVLVKLDSKINIIARSHIQDVDVNKILMRFGGGGHSSAASAKVTDTDISAVKDRLIRLLKKTIRAKVSAGDIMSSPATISVDMDIKHAKDFLVKNRIDWAVVVSEDGIFYGIVSSKNINKALYRGAGSARVKGYTLTKVTTIKPNTPLYTIQEYFVAKDIGILPVLRRKSLVGVVTRNDVLKVLHQGLVVDEKIQRWVKKEPILNLKREMEKVLPKKVMGLLKLVGDIAQEKLYSAFVVGGFVRDLIIGVRNFDIDIVIEGDAIAFSKVFADKVNGVLVIHKKFGTATVVMPWGLVKGERFKLDIATARKEKYKMPAALPDVEFSQLRDDLYRRDFTINAMAIALNKNNFGQLIDFFNGQRHLREGIISVLHEGSFIDDPTRIFRAVRFEQRFGFKIDKYTEELIKNAIKKDMFSRTGNMRIRDELILMLKEENPILAIKRMHQLDELRFIHPKIKFGKRLVTLFESINKVCQWYKEASIKRKRILDVWLIYLMGLFDNLNIKIVKSLCDKFAFRRGDKLRIISYKRESKKILDFFSQDRRLFPSEVYKRLHHLSYEVILLILAKARRKKAIEYIINFLVDYNRIKIKSTGDDLERIGFTPGPYLGKTLERILYAKLDGRVRTKRDEILYAQRIYKTMPNRAKKG